MQQNSRFVTFSPTETVAGNSVLPRPFSLLRSTLKCLSLTNDGKVKGYPDQHGLRYTGYARSATPPFPSRDPCSAAVPLSPARITCTIHGIKNPMIPAKGE